LRTILVTGASTGIGEATARRLAGRGWRVYAGVRTAGDAPAGTEEVLLDVTDATAIAAAAERVDRLDALVNNAGIAVAGPLEYLPVAELRRQLEVNLIGQLAVTQAFLPALRRSGATATSVEEPSQNRHEGHLAPDQTGAYPGSSPLGGWGLGMATGHAPEGHVRSAGAPSVPAARAARTTGRIVFIGSIAGRSSLPFLGAYAMSKFALEALADALRVELAQDGIQVSIVEPGSILTPIWTKPQPVADALPPEASERYGKRIAKFRELAQKRARKGVPPDAVARAVEHALTARHAPARTLVGRDAKLRAALEHLPTRPRDRLVSRILLGR
jgi:NAD(P)-dependent dehydrogenase (short-subunit alcohol dehydrogenase family)